MNTWKFIFWQFKLEAGERKAENTTEEKEEEEDEVRAGKTEKTT